MRNTRIHCPFRTNPAAINTSRMPHAMRFSSNVNAEELRGPHCSGISFIRGKSTQQVDVKIALFRRFLLSSFSSQIRPELLFNRAFLHNEPAPYLTLKSTLSPHSPFRSYLAIYLQT